MHRFGTVCMLKVEPIGIADRVDIGYGKEIGIQDDQKVLEPEKAEVCSFHLRSWKKYPEGHNCECEISSLASERSSFIFVLDMTLDFKGRHIS